MPGTDSKEDPETFLRDLFARAVERADPMHCVPAALPPRPSGRVLVVGSGKASARMAEAAERIWGELSGLVITRYGHSRPTRGIEIVEAAHPVPDTAGCAATARILSMLHGLGPDDFVLALISGGGSALLVQPAGDITLKQKQAINTALLASGATISEMNTVRKHLSLVKGGQMAGAAYPARMLALMISDVPGDDPAFIASGPTVGDASTPAQARAILAKWRIDVPPSVDAVLNGDTGVLPPDAPQLSAVENRVIAAPSQSLQAAAEMATATGCHVETLGDAIEGEARRVAQDQAARAKTIAGNMRPGDRPVLLLSGGECTVTRRGDGVGGPNAEFCLALALALDGAPRIHALACDTDGVDGAAEVAGAIVGPDTLRRAAKHGLDAVGMLDRNDAHSFFAMLGNQVATGPTLTNVNDFRAILIHPPFAG